MFFFDKNYGLFIGQLRDNKFHSHYALQISLSTKPNLVLSINNETNISGSAFFLNSKVDHKLICDNIQLTILINPLSAVGHQLFLKHRNSEYLRLSDNLSKGLISLLDKFERKKMTFDVFCNSISNTLTDYKCVCLQENYLDDNRIIKSIEFMDKYFDCVLSLDRVAEYCNLSSTRFLHLFKEKTNLNFRRYQLWNRVVKSLPYLTNNSITDTAYTFGFSDSSHYTRTFIETFGVTPKFFKPKD